MDRVFLDANVIFSAAYSATSRLIALWNLPETELVSSPYAVAEAYWNLADKRPEQLPTLRSLLSSIKLARETAMESPYLTALPDKDRPILAAAIGGGCSHLLTGDSDFRPLWGTIVAGVLVLKPGDYLRKRLDS